MYIFLIVLAIIAALILILLLIPLNLTLRYDRDGVNNEFSITVKYLFFTFKPSKQSKKEQKKDNKKPKKNESSEKEPFSFEREKARLDRYIELYGKLKDDAVELLDYCASKYIVFEKIGIDICFGFGDAMYTGIFTGVLNGFVYSILGIIHHRSDLRDMQVNIQPDFENEKFHTHSECILRLKNVHIIVIVINVLKIIRKIKKGRK